jgi:hypothetical protein
MSLSFEDKLKIINCLVRATFAKEATDPAIPTTVAVQTSIGAIEFERAHFVLRGYKGIVPGTGVVQILEQNPAKTGSWCGILASKYGIKVAWLWVNNSYNRCLIDLGDEDVLFFDATGGANATRDEVKAHPRIKEIIDRYDANREAQLKANKNIKHFD